MYPEPDSSSKSRSIQCLWDGALVIVNNLDPDADASVKETDLSLLKDDLNKLAGLFQR